MKNIKEINKDTKICSYHIETDNLLQNVSQIKEINIYDMREKSLQKFTSENIEEAIAHLQNYDIIVGHNSVSFHLQVIKKLYGVDFFDKNIDTIILSKLYNVSMQHSLKKYATIFNIDITDVGNKAIVSAKVFAELYKRMDVLGKYVRLEHSVANVQSIIEQNGIDFKTDDAIKFTTFISEKMKNVEDHVKQYNMLKSRVNVAYSLIRASDNGRISSKADTIGTNTHRFSHKAIVNIPSKKSEYGIFLRSLFYVKDVDNVMIGADLANLEIRILAHFLNNDNFTKLVSSEDIDFYDYIAKEIGDIIGKEIDRGGAKTAYISYIYGVSTKSFSNKFGVSYEQSVNIFNKFSSISSGIEELKNGLKEAYKRDGYIISLDGRKITTDKPYALLNALIQSSASVYAKTLLVMINNSINKYGGKLWLYMHDEFQLYCNKKYINKISREIYDNIVKCDNFYKLNCANKICVKVAKDYANTH